MAAPLRDSELVRILKTAGALYLIRELSVLIGLHSEGLMWTFAIFADIYHVYDLQFRDGGLAQLFNFGDMVGRTLSASGTLLLSGLFIYWASQQSGSEDFFGGFDLRHPVTVGVSTAIYSGIRIVTNFGLGLGMMAAAGVHLIINKLVLGQNEINIEN